MTCLTTSWESPFNTWMDRMPITAASSNPISKASYSATLFVHGKLSRYEWWESRPLGEKKTRPAPAPPCVLEPSKYICHGVVVRRMTSDRATACLSPTDDLSKIRCSMSTFDRNWMKTLTRQKPIFQSDLWEMVSITCLWSNRFYPSPHDFASVTDNAEAWPLWNTGTKTSYQFESHFFLAP